ncbi:glutamate racemase [Candidatus Saccharibacteria bacterium]|nr:glutamate racemase [Candidatus Saccharibacteria bacterium]
MKIGVFDSGKGGTTILEEIKKILPNEEYLFVGDSKNCPYGEKTDSELMEIVIDIVERLKKWGAKIIVVACNTATAKCINRLRKLYPEIKFVGTEPAIRLAAKTDAKRVLVMATPGTIKSERIEKLLKNNRKLGQDITLLACPGLADAIEKGQNVKAILKKILVGESQYDCVVLGCTHYSLIKSKIQKFFPQAELIDGNVGVANRVKELKLLVEK